MITRSFERNELYTPLKDETNSITVVNNIFSILILLLPFFYQYKGIGNIISFGELLLLPFIVFYAFYSLLKRKKLVIDYYLFVFYFISIFTSVLNAGEPYFSFSSFFTVFARLVYYSALILFARSYFSLKNIFKFYKAIVFVFSLYLIVQFLYTKLTGGYLPIYVNYSLLFPPEARNADLSLFYRWSFRPSSLFLEPSYFVFFIFPCFCLVTFMKKKAFDYAFLGVIVVSVLLSSSAAGVILLSITIISKLVFNSRNRMDLSIVAVAFVLLLVIAYFSGYFDFLPGLSRIKGGGSINQRIIRGILIYRDFDFYHKLFGVGLNNLEPYMRYFSLVTSFDESNLNYCASLIQTLNYSGIVGFVGLIALIVSYFAKCVKYNKNSVPREKIGFLFAFLFCICFVLSYESVLFMYRFSYILIIFESVLFKTHPFKIGE